MSYRVERLSLTATWDSRSRATMLVRLPRRRGKLQNRVFVNFQLLARRLARSSRRSDLGDDLSVQRWLKSAGGSRRHLDALRMLARGDALAVVAPLVVGNGVPRMDEILRLVTALELARLLRNRRVGRVVVLAWACRAIGEDGETGASAVVQRSGEYEDIGFRGGDPKHWLRDLRAAMPGTGFSSLVLDRIARATAPDPDLVKARLLLDWFPDSDLTILPPSVTPADLPGFEARLSALFARLPLLAVVTPGGSPTAGIPEASPVPFPAIGATVVEGKVEGWLSKFGVTVEDVLCREASAETLSTSSLPADTRGLFASFKERALGELLRLELGLNELGLHPAGGVRKALEGFDIGCDRLRTRALAEEHSEIEINLRQAKKLFQYLLPDRRPQQEVVSVPHYLNFYGFEFLAGLREVLAADDLRHQVVFVAPEASRN